MRFRLLPWLALAAAAATRAESPDIDPARCVIVTPAQPNAVVIYAAAELQLHLQLVTGRTIPVASEARPGRYPIHLGTAPAGDGRALAPEEGRWTVGADGIWLYGADQIRKPGASPADTALDMENQTGTLFAVYGFLEDGLGIHWVEPGLGGIVHPREAQLHLAAAAGDWAPQLVQRMIRSGYREAAHEASDAADLVPPELRFTAAEFTQRVRDEAVWKRRLRMGRHADAPYGSPFGDWWRKYGRTHPEYFAADAAGKRGPQGKAGKFQMCVSNPGVARTLVADYAAQGAGAFIKTDDNSSRGFCRCDDCAALDVRLPGEEDLDVESLPMSDRYIHFVNAVLAQAKLRNPAVRTVYYAYSSYHLAPRREQLDDHILVLLLPVFAMDAGETAGFYRDWKKANATEAYLRPNDLCQDTGLPMGFERHMFERFQQARRILNVTGTDYDSLWDFWPESGEANYLMARAFAAPDRSFADLDQEYCGTFGAAAPDLRDYEAYWRQIWEVRAMRNRTRINRLPAALKLTRTKLIALSDLLYTEADFDRTDAMLRRALTRPLDDGERSRVENLALANQHSRLTYLARAANRLGSPVPVAEQRAATQALAGFRKAHRRDLNFDWDLLCTLENAPEDPAGFQRLRGTESPRLRTYRTGMDQAVAAARIGNDQPLR